MRTTDIGFRSPKQPNVAYNLAPDITEGQRHNTYRFLKDTRFAYGSIYQNPSQYAPRVGPSSYENLRKNDRACAVTFQPVFIEAATGYSQDHFEFVQGQRMLQVGSLSRTEQAKFPLTCGNTQTPLNLRSQFHKTSQSMLISTQSKSVRQLRQSA